MHHKSFILNFALCILALLFCFAFTGQAADFPTKSIHYVNHNNPGSGTDRVARMAAKVITDNHFLPVPIKVENKPGGSGEVARAYVAQHAGDAHYIMTLQPTSVSTPMTRSSKLTWDFFTPIANLLVDTNVIAVSYESPYNTLKDLLAHAKKEPNTITFTGNSMGGNEYFAFYLLNKISGAKMKFVAIQPSEQIPGILGGHYQVMSANPTEVVQLVEAKKLKILAILSEERSEAFPKIPTAREQGYDVVLYSFRGVTAAPKIPDADADYLEKVFEKVCKDDQFKKYASALGADVKFMDRKQLAKYLQHEAATYKEILQEAGLLKTK